MPILSKKPMKKSTKKPFKPPVQAKGNIEKILGTGSQSQTEKAVETVDNGLNDSVSTTSTSISSRLNEPAIKKMYMDFTVNLSKQIICSTPLPSSQEVKEEDLANMSFKDHMINLLNNGQEEPLEEPLAEIASEEEQKKDNSDPAISLSQEMLNRKEVKEAYMEFLKNGNDEEDLDFMKNFKKTKKVKRIFSSFEENEKNKQKDKNADKSAKSKKSKKLPVPKKVDGNKVRKSKKLEEFSKNKEPKDDKVAEKPKKQQKPRTQKEKAPEDSKTMEINISKRLEIDKGKPTKTITSATNKREDVNVQMESGVFTDKSTLKQLSSESDNLQAAANHRKLHTRALSPNSKQSNESSTFRVNEQQALVCENSLYDVGTVVWAKLDGYPWWPAMVDEDPDFQTHIWVEENFKEPTWYHVTFFDTQEVTRSWVRPDDIRAYNMPMAISKNCPKMFSARLRGSNKQAANALGMSWSGRIAKYGFLVRYPNGVGDLEKKREEKRKLEEIREQKRQKRKEKYLQKLKSKVVKARRNDVEEKKKKNSLRLYSTEIDKELQKLVDSMCVDMNGKENLDEISIDMLEIEDQKENIPPNDSAVVY